MRRAAGRLPQENLDQVLRPMPPRELRSLRIQAIPWQSSQPPSPRYAESVQKNNPLASSLMFCCHSLGADVLPGSAPEILGQEQGAHTCGAGGGQQRQSPSDVS